MSKNASLLLRNGRNKLLFESVNIQKSTLFCCIEITIELLGKLITIFFNIAIKIVLVYFHFVKQHSYQHSSNVTH